MRVIGQEVVKVDGVGTSVEQIGIECRLLIVAGGDDLAGEVCEAVVDRDGEMLGNHDHQQRQAVVDRADCDASLSARARMALQESLACQRGGDLSHVCTGTGGWLLFGHDDRRRVVQVQGPGIHPAAAHGIAHDRSGSEDLAHMRGADGAPLERLANRGVL